MSTDLINTKTDSMSPSVAKAAPTEQQQSEPGVPKRITNAQTVCNVKNEKGKLCNGHLKQVREGVEPAEVHLRGDDVLFQCQTCGTLYMGPPMGHVRDPKKQSRFVEAELMAILQAAGGTLPAFRKSETGAWVPVAEQESHAAAAPTTATAAAAKSSQAGGKTAATAKAVSPTGPAKPAETPSSGPTAAPSKKSIPPPPPHLAPPANETPEEKRARLARIVAEAKARAGKDVPPSIAAAAASAPPSPTPRTKPTVASTSGLDSSASADTHRPAAEAQAATGLPSAAPLSAATATASPAAGAETPTDLAPDASTELTPGAPKAAAPKRAVVASASGKSIPPPPPHLAPPPGETHEEKIARLKRIVEEAKARAGKS